MIRMLFGEELRKVSSLEILNSGKTTLMEVEGIIIAEDDMVSIDDIYYHVDLNVYSFGTESTTLQISDL